MRWLLILTVAVAGCTSPFQRSQVPDVKADRDTSYSVEDRPGGFTLSIAYSRYQFIPESSAVAIACKQALTATAFDVAEKRGRKIEAVNEQRIRLSMGRNGLTGITSCSASVPIRWAN